MASFGVEVLVDSENVIDTVAAAAAAVDYPKDKFRVFVSDDGKDPELEGAAGELEDDCTANADQLPRAR